LDWLDTTIANVVLNYIAGGMGVSEDDASWVVACVRRRHFEMGRSRADSRGLSRPRREAPLLPEVLERRRTQLRVARGVLDRSMPSQF
jgi:hypothetical protein